MENNLTKEIIVQTIDSGLSSLGESGKQALWFYLESQGFNQQNAPENIEAFVQALKNFFGIGYTFLDEIFRQQLSVRIGKDLSSYTNFVDCIVDFKTQNK